MKYLSVTLFTLIALVIPASAGAQALNQLNNVNDVIRRALGLGNVFIYILIGLGVIFIVWNVVIYIIRGSDPSKKSEAGLNVLWGIVGLAIIASLWGLVNLLVNTFSTNPNVPRNRFPTADFSSPYQGQSVQYYAVPVIQPAQSSSNVPSYGVDNPGGDFLTPGSAANGADVATPAADKSTNYNNVGNTNNNLDNYNH